MVFRIGTVHWVSGLQWLLCYGYEWRMGSCIIRPKEWLAMSSKKLEHYIASASIKSKQILQAILLLYNCIRHMTR